MMRWFVRHPIANAVFILAMLVGAGILGLHDLLRLPPSGRHQALLAFGIAAPATFSLFVAYWAHLSHRGKLDLNPETQLATSRRALGPGLFVGAVLLFLTQSSGPIAGGLVAGVSGGLLFAAAVCRIALSLGIGRAASERASAARKRAQARPDWDEMERILERGKARNHERGKVVDPVLPDVGRLVKELKSDERSTGR